MGREYPERGLVLTESDGFRAPGGFETPRGACPTKGVRTMRTVTKIAGAAVGLALLLPQSVEGQGVVSRAQSCSGGVLVGHLGISGLDCVGECSMIIHDG